MYQLLTGGGHPLFKEDDSSLIYKEKLQRVEVQLDGNPKAFSWLASNLFQRLTMKTPNKRYTALEALNHPWITRKKENQIPLSLGDQIRQLEQEKQLKLKVQLAFFLASTKLKQSEI